MNYDREIFSPCMNLMQFNYKPIYSDSFYRNAASLNFGDKRDLILRWNRNPLRPNISPIALEFNPSKWSNILEIKNALSNFVDPEDAVIDRLDLAIDLNEPLEEILKGLRVKHKQWSEEISSKQRKRGHITGYYYGRKPYLICVYDKAFQLRSLRTASQIQGEFAGISTRIETRFFNKAVFTKKLKDLPILFEKNPFENLEFYSFPHEMKTLKGQRFLERVNHIGFHDAFFEFNQEGNFKRTIGKQLKERPLAIELHHILKEELRSFLLTKVEKNRMEIL